MRDVLQAVRGTLDVLRKYYADRDGKAYPLNETQIAVYVDGLSRFTAGELEAAAREHMRRSQYFPKLSELLAVLDPPRDYQAMAHLAWSRLEREARRLGAYRSVQFEDPAFGEAVKQVFGSWAAVCSFDIESPAWAIRRQTFLQVFPIVAEQHQAESPVLGGLLRYGELAVIRHLEGLPEPKALGAGVDKTRSVLAEVKRRAIEAGVVKE